MAKHSTNRLHSFWPKPSASNEATGSMDSNKFAAKMEPIVENVGAAIATHPRMSLTVAAAIGAALGWFIKRK